MTACCKHGWDCDHSSLSDSIGLKPGLLCFGRRAAFQSLGTPRRAARAGFEIVGRPRDGRRSCTGIHRIDGASRHHPV